MSPRLQSSVNESKGKKHPSQTYDNIAWEGIPEGFTTRDGNKHVHSNHIGETTKADLRYEDPEAWQPFWLKKETLGAFTFLYLFFAVVLMALLITSQRNSGLVEGRKELEMLWKFAPTAVFTLAATFWARVELQTLRYYPWAVIQNEPPTRHNVYTLDYNAMITVRVMYNALQRRHLLVFFVVLTSVILKVQVVLGPSIFYLDSQFRSSPTAVQALDSFDTANAQDRGDLPLFGLQHAVGIRKFGMSRPFGVSENGTYQTFDLKGGESRGTIEAPVTAVVDGVFMDIKCIPLVDYSVTKPWAVTGQYNESYTTLELEFEGCEQSIEYEVEMSERAVDKGKEASTWGIMPLYTEKEDEGKTNFTSGVPFSKTLGSWTDHPRPICSSLSQQFPPFIYFGAYWKPSEANRTNYELMAHAGVICSPTGWISKVQVTDDGVDPKVATVPGQENTPMALNPWNILSNIGGQRAGGGSGTVIGPLVFSYMLTDYPEFDQVGTNLALYSNSMLTDAVYNMTKMSGPVILSYQLRHTNESEVTGTRQTSVNKLQVRLSVCVPVIILFLISSIIACVGMVRISPLFRIWFRNPTTILGSALFFGSKSKLSTAVKEDLLETRGISKDIWQHSNYSPPSLRTWVRSIFVLYALALIVTLAVTLWISKMQNGLAKVSQGAQAIWWTSIPALAMTLATLYTTSSDSEIRKLSLHFCVNTRPCKAMELDMCLLDMLGLRALYHSFGLRLPVVTLVQGLAILSGFLAALSSLLFTTIEITKWEDMTFAPTDTFSNDGTKPEQGLGYEGAMQSLITTYDRSNFTWPKGTYGSLLFPTLDIGALEGLDSSSATLEFDTPAVTLRPVCENISSGNDITIKPTEDDRDEPVYVTINNKHNCTGGGSASLSVSIVSSNYVEGKYYFAATQEGKSCKGDSATVANGTVTHIWGSVPYNHSTPDYYAIVKCAYTWAEVSTKVKMSYTGGVLQFDQNKPPSPDLATLTPWNKTTFAMPRQIDNMWPTLGGTDTKQGGNYGAFGLLIEPFGKMKLQDFGDSAKENDVLAELHTKRAIYAAQLANNGNRVQINQSSSAGPEAVVVNARVSLGATRRLDQSAPITYVIISILFLAFLINLWALISGVLGRFLDNKRRWLLDMSMRGLAPDQFGSIIMADSLLLGSNYQKFIPEESHLEKPDVLHQKLAHLRFRMGGFIRRGQEKKVTLGVLDDDELQFLGG
ncbi:unnamed protein product [Clonostachys chloroleuca]|uniref:Uncharacterized protein n=1 Tax=Clonostachys chloroleuca TaxID=1926264 RepID=A0AA35VLG9_9HYPO|nr:unnamed protein product [Clonostachys chloroleuca]